MTEIYCRMVLSYGDSWLVQIKSYNWVDLFRNGKTSELNIVLSVHGRLPTNAGEAESPDRRALTSDGDKIAPLL